jgi:hypothetical protein
MDRCQHCQEQLLDFLYDLLDEPDQIALEAHLVGCAACQAALTRARRQQDILASVARLECDSLHFEIPTDEPVPEPAAPLEEPAVLPLPHRPARAPRRFWQPWVAAAATLLVIAGAGLYFHLDQAAARERVAQDQQRWQDTTAELAQVFQREQEVQQHRTNEIQDLDARERVDELRVQVTGPRVLAGKGTAPFRVDATDLAGRNVTAQVEARLQRRDGEAKEKESLALERDKAAGAFRVPDDARLDPAGDYQVVVYAERKGGVSVSVPVPVEAAARQFVTYLTTDRPLYQTGTDVVNFRSLTLDRRSLRPVADELLLQYHLGLPGGQEVLLTQGVDRLREAGGDGKVLRGPDNQPLRGIGAGSFPLEPTLPAGEYSLIVRELRGRIPETRTRFLVQKAGAARLESGWQWHRSEYSAGQEVLASAKLIRAGGEPVRGKLVTLTLVSEGRALTDAQMVMTDGEGRLQVQSRLPASWTGPATLVLSLQDGLSRDEIRAPLPVRLPGAVVDLYPEGGDLVAGLESRVYFQAKDRRGRPVALRGELFENDRPTGIFVQTVTVPELGANSGLGSFRFTPKVGARYAVHVDAPTETPRVPLPPVQSEGVVLTVAEPVCEAGQPLKIGVRSTSSRTLQATLTCRGQVLEVVRLGPGQNEATFTTRGARGVCRVTVHEEVTLLGHDRPALPLATALAGSIDGPLAAATTLLSGAWQKSELVPRAERLVFCRPVERLEIDLRVNRETYKPGEKARLEFAALDEHKSGVPAIAQIAIVDRNALVGAEEKTLRSLPAHAWLAGELHSPDLLERADALLLPVSASRQALDLVLATQGWRRFQPAVEEEADEERLVTVQGRHVPDYPGLARERDRVESLSGEQLGALGTRANQLSARLDEMKADGAASAALARLAWYQEHAPNLRRGLLLALAALLIVFLMVVLGQVLLAELRRTPCWLALSGGCAGLLIVALSVAQPVPLTVAFGEQPERVFAKVQEKLPAENQQQVNQGQDKGRDKQHLEHKQDGNGLWMERGFLDDLAKQNQWGHTGKESKMAAADGLLGGQGGEKRMYSDDVNRALGKSKAGPPRTTSGAFGARGGAGVATDEVNEAGKKDNLDRSPLVTKEGPPMNLALPGHPGAQAGMAQSQPDKKGESAAEQLRKELEAEGKLEKGTQAKNSNFKHLDPADQERVLREQFLRVRVAGNAAKKKQADMDSFDCTPTVFWHPVLVLPGGGTAIEFQLGANPTRYRIDVQAHSLDGRVGNVRKDLETTGSGSK